MQIFKDQIWFPESKQKGSKVMPPKKNRKQNEFQQKKSLSLISSTTSRNYPNSLGLILGLCNLALDANICA